MISSLKASLVPEVEGGPKTEMATAGKEGSTSDHFWALFGCPYGVAARASYTSCGVSLSCGTAETPDFEDADRLIRKADGVLYDARQFGRPVVYSDSLAAKQIDPICIEALSISRDLAINTQADAA